jgi:Trk-type K+ transport system membrane component
VIEAPLPDEAGRASARPAKGTARTRGTWLREKIDEAARRSPARMALSVFAAVIAVFVLLLWLPISTHSGDAPPFIVALFTGTSAVCVTGLVVVDTASYWSGFGHLVILAGIKIGGLGVLTLASLLGLATSRRLGLAQRIIAASETKAARLGEVGALLKAVIITSTAIEVVVAIVLFPRFLLREEGILVALWHSVFYAVSASNNAGFILHSSLLPWVGDWWFCIPIAVGVFIGSLGFPVVLALSTQWRRPSEWSLNTKLTLATTSTLFLLCMLMFAAFEWTNPSTLRPLDPDEKVLATIFAAVMPRSGGFNTLDVAQMNETTWLTFDVFMFIGGGSASTAGGIKVGTLAVLALAGLAEARGDPDIEAFSRRIPTDTVRLAITVLLAGITFVGVSTLALLAISDGQLDKILFEVTSAFATCGLSVNFAAELPPAGQYLLVGLMYAGRTGTMTLAAALALRDRQRVYRLPEDRPIVG